MGWKKEMYALKENRLFFRILLYFLSLLIPIIVVGTIMYNNSVKITERDFSEKIKLNLQSSAKTIDIYLRTAQETGINFFSSNLVQRNLVPESTMTPEQWVEQPHIIKALQFHRNIVSEFIDNMFVYVDDRKVYTSSGIDDFDLFFAKFYRMESYGTDFWRNTLNSARSLELLTPTRIENRTVIPLVMKQMINGHQAVLVSNISTDTIYRTLKNNSIFPSTDFMIVNGQKEPIVSSGNDSLDESNRDVVTTSALSDMYGWEYYAYTSKSELQQYTTGIYQLTLILCVILTVLGTVVSFIYSSRLYSPIKNIRNILLKGAPVTVSPAGHSYAHELDLIGSGIHRLIENNIDFRNRVKRISDDYLNHSFVNLIRGTHERQEEALRNILQDEVGFREEGYLCCIIAFDYKDEFHREFPDIDLPTISSKLKLIVWDVLQRHVQHYLIDIKHDHFVSIVNVADEANKAKLMQALKQLAETFAFDAAYYEITMSIGNIYRHLRDVAKSYDDAITAMDRHARNDRSQIIDAAASSPAIHFHFSFVEQNKIINCLKIGDIACLDTVIKDIVRHNRKLGVSRHDMGLLFIELYQTGNRFAVEQGLDMKDMVAETERDMLYSRNSINANHAWTKDFLLRFFGKIIELTQQSGENRSYSLVSHILNYIEHNVSEDLYLEKIAEEMDLSAKYISRVFKEKMGTNLTDYIGKIRIDIAKRLLLETNINIDQVAKQVGLLSRTTFIRTFKKFEGVTPLDYRRRV